MVGYILRPGMIYRILPNTRAGANTKNSTGALVFIIRSKSNDVGWLRGLLAVSFSMAGKSRVMHTQITEIKWLLVILDLYL